MLFFQRSPAFAPLRCSLGPFAKPSIALASSNRPASDDLVCVSRNHIGDGSNGGLRARLAGAACRCDTSRQVRRQRPGKRSCGTIGETMRLAAKLFAVLLILIA